MTDAAKIADGWIAHDGGPKPLGIKYPIQVMFRDDQIEQFVTAGEFEWKSAAYKFGKHFYPNGHFSDIIAYRPIRAELERNSHE